MNTYNLGDKAYGGIYVGDTNDKTHHIFVKLDTGCSTYRKPDYDFKYGYRLADKETAEEIRTRILASGLSMPDVWYWLADNEGKYATCFNFKTGEYKPVFKASNGYRHLLCLVVTTEETKVKEGLRHLILRWPVLTTELVTVEVKDVKYDISITKHDPQYGLRDLVEDTPIAKEETIFESGIPMHEDQPKLIKPSVWSRITSKLFKAN